jgi:hypothetical protein
MGRGEGSGAKGQRGQDKDVRADLDALFQLPLSEFTSARNELVAKLKKSGDAANAEQVKALGKPSISAWVANQLYWRERKAFERLLVAGEAFRTAQAAQLAGKSADVRAPLDARREALAELSKQAASVLRDTGHPATPDTMRRIMTTLEALATYGESQDAPAPGRLTADVDPPGFEALAALVPHSGQRGLRGTTPTRVIPFNQPKPKSVLKKKGDTEADARREAAERKAREVELRKALNEAERALKDAKRAAEKASEQMKKAAARAKDTERLRASLEPRWEKAVAESEAAKKDARRIAGEAEAAAQAVDDAERAVVTAADQLKSI